MEAKSTPFSGLDSLSLADIFPRTSGDIVSSDSSVVASSVPFVSKDSMSADRVSMENRLVDGNCMDQAAEENDWFGYKPAISDDFGILHDGLDMADIEDCSTAFAGELECNTIDFDAIDDLGLITADVMTGIKSRHCAPGSLDSQPEMISDQSSFSDCTNQAGDSVIGDNLVTCEDDTQDNTALNVAGGLQLGGPDALCMKTDATLLTSVSSDVPFCLASNVSLFPSAKCELATSFLTPKTPTQSQGLPTYATHFSFSSPDMSQSGAVSVSRPKTPVVSVSLPVRAHPLLSPHTPYTPDTPSMFQFPSPKQSPANSTSCSPASRHSKRHSANYHPYISPASSTTGPHHVNQHQAAAQQLEQQKRMEMEVADNEIDEYIRKLKQADQQQRQPLQVPDACLKAMSSKLSLIVPTETGVLSDTNNVSSSATSCQQVVSPIEEVIKILVAERFGVTVPSKFRPHNLKHTAHDPKVRSELTSLPTSTDGRAVEEFRNPDTMPASKPRKRKPEPLIIPASVSNFGFRSQLRSPKLLESGYSTQQTTPPPYTPPPMISPARTGSGLFWTLHGSRQIFTGPLSAPPCQSLFSGMYNAQSIIIIIK